MYELKKNGKVFTSKAVGTGPSSFEIKNLPGRGLTKVENRCTKSICVPYVTRIPAAKSNKLKCSSDSVSVLWLNRSVRFPAAVREGSELCFHCHMQLQDLRYYRYD